MGYELLTENRGGNGGTVALETTFDDGENQLHRENFVALGRIQTLGGEVIELTGFKIGQPSNY